MPRTLQIGFTGDDVTALQHLLNTRPLTPFINFQEGAAPPPLALDGVFGAPTQERVMAFQRRHRLVADGIVELRTWGKLLDCTVIATTGFSVLGANLFDSDGTRVVLRGVNKMCVFDNDDPLGAVSFEEIKKTGANSVRIVWAINTDLDPAGPATSPATLEALITNAKANHLIPMIELHDATGVWGRLPDLVAYWTRPDIVGIIQAHQNHLLINIGNEVGDDTVSQADFVAAYSDAVLQMRAAGIHTPLVIDAPDWGKNLAILNGTADTLSVADPEGNLMFSVHMYWSMSCAADAAFIRTNLEQSGGLEYALIVGEFSQYGGYPCGDPGASICGAAGEVDYQTILKVCHELGIGWYAWEWGPGNGYVDPLCAVMDMTVDRRFTTLKPGWAYEVAVSSPYGIQQTAITPPSI